MPLSEVKAGMQGVGRSVFSGGRVEEFQVEVLGIMENAGPKQSIILGRLSGGPLQHTGVMQGMSGSPVYVNGRLVGAVALSFPFSKDPIAGIRPIEEMMASAGPLRQAAAPRYPADAVEALPRRQAFPVGPDNMLEIATPLWVSGFTRGTLDRFAPALREAGMEFAQGVSGGGRPQQPTGAVKPPEPGSMISVQLMTGDMSVGADGTLTMVDGKRVYAFGHRFLAVGDTELPFARSEVITLLASQNSSFKISSPKEWLGTITSDRATAISGELGRRAALLPLAINVKGRGAASRQWSYRMQMVDDRLFTPLLVQMAVQNAIDATERSTGLSTIIVEGRILLDGAAPVRTSNIYAAELGAPQLVSASVAAPLIALMQSGFDRLKVRGLEIDIEIANEKRQLQIDSTWATPREVRPGGTVEITATFRGEHGVELTRKANYQVPLGAQPGPLLFTVTDGVSSNLVEYRQFLLTPPQTAEQLHEFLNGLHPSDRPYLRIWRQTPGWQLQGETLSQVPPSVSLAISRTATIQPSSKVAVVEMAPAEFVFSGSKTIQVDVKE